MRRKSAYNRAIGCESLAVINRREYNGVMGKSKSYWMTGKEGWVQASGIGIKKRRKLSGKEKEGQGKDTVSDREKRQGGNSSVNAEIVAKNNN